MRLLTLLLVFLGVAVAAAPQAYRLDTARSMVAFTYLFEGSERTGRMPVLSADMRIDLDNVPASNVTVRLDVRRAQAGFIFATDVMKGNEVLDAANHPTILFQSTAITGDLRGASVAGNLTVRGVTRPVTLKAGLYRQRGTEMQDRDNLTVLLTGEIDRHDFGASGFPGFVGPVIGLRIVAHISK